MLLAQNKLIRIGAGLIGGLLLLTVIFYFGKREGKATIQKEWDIQKVEQKAAIDQLKLEISFKEQLAQIESKRIYDALDSSNQNHQSSLAALHADYSQRLLAVQERTGIYQRLSEAGPASQQRLASYASQFDRSLEEGRQLVKELGLTLEQRERELNLLGDQILSDRKVIGEKDVSQSQ